MHRKLVGKKRKSDGEYAVGLVPPREPAEKANPELLSDFLAEYIKKRSDVRGSTAIVYGHTKRCLVKFFGADKPLAAITPGGCDEFAR